jgi:hypothetical protein
MKYRSRPLVPQAQLVLQSPQHDEEGFCCKNHYASATSVRKHLLFSLGGHSKYAGDERDLPFDFVPGHSLNLSLANHVHCFIAMERSLRMCQN